MLPSYRVRYHDSELHSESGLPALDGMEERMILRIILRISLQLHWLV